MRRARNYETTATYNSGNQQSQVDRAYQQGKDDRTSGRAKRSIGVSYQWAYNAGWKDAGKLAVAQGVA